MMALFHHLFRHPTETIDVLERSAQINMKAGQDSANRFWDQHKKGFH